MPYISLNLLLAILQGVSFCFFIGSLSGKKQSIKTILLFSIPYGTAAYAIHRLLYGSHTLVILGITILLLPIVFKIDLILSFTLTLLFSLLPGVFELMITLIYIFGFRFTIKDIQNSPLLLTTANFIIQMILLGFSMYIQHKDIKLKKTIFLNHKLNTLLTYIFSIILLLLLQLYVIDLNSLKLPMPSLLFLLSIFILTVLTTYEMVKSIIHTNINENLLKEQEVYVENIESLVGCLRTQKHEFGNHLNMIYGLAQSDDIKRLKIIKEYIEDLDANMKISSNALQVDEPILSALLCTKIALAEQNDIEIDVEICDDLTSTPLSLPEITVILNNLLGNAIEFCSCLPLESRYICLNTYSDPQSVYISVSNENNGLPLDKATKKKIFDKGFSTKENPNGCRGFGLHNVAEIISKHAGNITVESDDEETVFSIVIPKLKKELSENL